MYESYWKLTARPFEEGGPAHSCAPTRTHSAALLKLRYLIDQRKGAALLAGEHGLGKTCLINVLEAECRAEGTARFVRLRFPLLQPAELLAWFAESLGIAISEQMGVSQILISLERFFANRSQATAQTVLVVDDAHLLEAPQLQALRLLLNLRDHGAADLSLILSGRNELLAQVQRQAALHQRIVVRSTLSPLDADEIELYVAHRLRAAGREAVVFDSSALRAIWEVSQGIPRRINQLCDLALLVGYVDELRSVGSAEVEAAAEELLSAA